jgi:hypothetical protein
MGSVCVAKICLPSIFELFRQADGGAPGAERGLGIGLSLVKQIVELHGGRVEARSAGLGQGSEFVVELPVTGAEAATPAPGTGSMKDPELESIPSRRLDHRNAMVPGSG